LPVSAWGGFADTDLSCRRWAICKLPSYPVVPGMRSSGHGWSRSVCWKAVGGFTAGEPCRCALARSYLTASCFIARVGREKTCGCTAKFTGYTRDGGYLASHVIADAGPIVSASVPRWRMCGGIARICGGADRMAQLSHGRGRDARSVSMALASPPYLAQVCSPIGRTVVVVCVSPGAGELGGTSFCGDSAARLGGARREGSRPPEAGSIAAIILRDDFGGALVPHFAIRSL